MKTGRSESFEYVLQVCETLYHFCNSCQNFKLLRVDVNAEIFSFLSVISDVEIMTK